MKNLNIKIGDKALNFLLYLVSIKQFDAISLWRVLHKPDQNDKLYEQYLKMRDKEYLDWAIEQVICWDRSKVDESVIHIHGDRDEVFPASNIPEFINIKGGTHIMILNRFKWFNENLPKLILEN